MVALWEWLLYLVTAPTTFELLTEKRWCLNHISFAGKAYKPNKDNVITVDFQITNKGKKSAAGHFGKAVKGEFIRYIAENNITDIEGFSGFEYEGFKWDGTSFVKENS